MKNNNDTHWMQKALLLADKALARGEVPIGSIIVLDNKIIGRGYNCPIAKCDPSAHAEIMALRSAGKKIGNYRLVNTTLYVTLEPCLMCMAAMRHARIKRLVFGAKNFLPMCDNHHIETTGGVLEDICSEKLKRFFKEKRQCKNIFI